MRINIFILFFLFNCFSFVSQNIRIIGKALGRDRPGKEISLYLYSDLVTKTKLKEANDTINPDGSFELKTSIFNIQAAEIKIENEVAKIYLEPYYQYSIFFPEKDTVNNFDSNLEFKTDLIIYGDSLELNARIIDFNTQFDEFWANKYKSFVTHAIQKDLDSFRIKMFKRYEKVKNRYFRSYLDYTFATIYENTGRLHNQLAYEYIIGKPILYSNFEYMDFFNQFFKQYLQKKIVSEKGDFILFSINEQPNLKALHATIISDPLLKNDSVRELVLLKNLFELYFTPGYNKTNIQSLIEEIRLSTKIKDHQLIAQNMNQYLHFLEPGAKAPNFTLQDVNGNWRSLTDFKGKFVYLFFYSSKSPQCIQELRMLEKIHEKQSRNVVFISVSIDDDKVSLSNFLKKNKKFSWLFLGYDNILQVKDVYNVKSTPASFFIGKNGELIFSPSALPSEGLEVKFNQFFKR